MQAGDLLQVFLRHTFDPCIPRVGNQGSIGLFEPVVQGLRMKTQQTSTLCDRKYGQNQNSCARKDPMRDNTRTDFQELRHFQEISGKSGK